MRLMRFVRMAAATSGLLVVIALYGCEQPESEGQSQVVDGLRFEYGVVRSDTVLTHPSDHPEGIMHQGVPTAPDSYHFVLAVFDAKTGSRIKDADASLELSGPGHPGHVIMPLELMAPVGDVTYGGYMSLPSAAKYRLTFDVAHAAGRRGLVKARFLFERPS
jgi:hypothetical protein